MARAVAKQGFTMIPDAIAQRTDLSFAAKCVLGYMARRATGGVWSGGVRMLAALWGTKHQRIADAILELERADMIRIERGKRGQRSRYHIPKASVYPTLSESLDPKSVRHADTASAIPTLAADIRTRKRLRPLETRESTLSHTRTAQKSRSAVAAELLDAVVALFYPSGVLDTQIDEVRGYTSQLATLGAAPDELESRRKRWTELGHDYTCRLKTLVEHWDDLAPPKPNPYNPFHVPRQGPDGAAKGLNRKETG